MITLESLEKMKKKPVIKVDEKPKVKRKRPDPSPTSIELVRLEVGLNPGATRVELMEVTKLGESCLFGCLTCLIESGKVKMVASKNKTLHKIHTYYIKGAKHEQASK